MIKAADSRPDRHGVYASGVGMEPKTCLTEEKRPFGFLVPIYSGVVARLLADPFILA
jgi:hypothetical protein